MFSGCLANALSDGLCCGSKWSVTEYALSLLGSLDADAKTQVPSSIDHVGADGSQDGPDGAVALVADVFERLHRMALKLLSANMFRCGADGEVRAVAPSNWCIPVVGAAGRLSSGCGEVLRGGVGPLRAGQMPELAR